MCSKTRKRRSRGLLSKHPPLQLKIWIPVIGSNARFLKGDVGQTEESPLWPPVQIRGVEADYVSARKHRSAGFRCEPKAPPAEWASAAERSPRYKPHPTMLVQRSSHHEIWFRSIYHRHRCSGPHWPTNSKRAHLHKQPRSVTACPET
jgi:hypothetical protein